MVADRLLIARQESIHVSPVNETRFDLRQGQLANGRAGTIFRAHGARLFFLRAGA